MALTTLSTVYTYYGTYNSATAYTAKNNAAKAWIEDMAAASIAGLTYSDKVSPDVTTTAQTFSVTFQTTQGYFIQFSLTTSTNVNTTASICLLAEDGTLISSFYPIGAVMSYAAPIATIQINLIRYFSASNYDIYAASGFGSINTFYPIGAVYTDNKTSAAPDYLVCSGILSAGYCVYDATHKLQIDVPRVGEPDASGLCVIMDAVALLYTSLKFLCTLKNCKHIGITDAASNLLTYTIGGATYINVAYGRVWLHVT